jgi:hypothetical protein
MGWLGFDFDSRGSRNDEKTPCHNSRVFDLLLVLMYLESLEELPEAWVQRSKLNPTEAMMLKRIGDFGNIPSQSLIVLNTTVQFFRSLMLFRSSYCRVGRFYLASHSIWCNLWYLQWGSFLGDPKVHNIQNRGTNNHHAPFVSFLNEALFVPHNSIYLITNNHQGTPIGIRLESLSPHVFLAK